MAYQSLYRRYRPGRFSELIGQDHVVAALRNAVREDRVGHAYLFSGPRGTGKTSTARILGKALNCQNLGDDGEPCGECESCVAFAAGTSYDMFELDAASNNGVDAIRDLIAKVALGSPGRTKVYVLDEVHMLTSGAENALLKTLEEPPDHVKFVLCTTEPHKVVSTIRSRTQHLRFELLPGELLTDHVRWVANDAGLDVDDEVVAHVVRQGGGSVRDTLSALDQVVAAGGMSGRSETGNRIVAALAAGDAAAVVAGLDEAAREGRDPRVIGESVLGRLREAFLASMGADLGQLSESDRAQASATAEVMPAPRLTRGLELLGAALVDMRQAPDPRIDLELALVRLSRPELDTDPAALLERLERLERGAPAPTPAAAPASTTAAAQEVPEPAQPAPQPTAHEQLSGDGGPAAAARARLASSTPIAVAPEPAPEPEPAAAPAPRAAEGPSKSLGALRRARQGTAPSASPAPVDELPAELGEPSPTSPPPTHVPGHDELTLAWADSILPALPNKAKARFSAGRFLESTAVAARFALPNQIHCDRCAELIPDVETALAAHFGHPVPLELVVDDGSAAAPVQPSSPATAADATDRDGGDHEMIELDELVDAPADEQSGIERLTDAFPGAELVDESEA